MCAYICQYIYIIYSGEDLWRRSPGWMRPSSLAAPPGVRRPTMMPRPKTVIHMHIHISKYTHVYVYIYIYVYIYMCLYICIYIYINVYMYIFEYRHIYICIYLWSRVPVEKVAGLDPPVVARRPPRREPLDDDGLNQGVGFRF